ncbi:MAG: WG repeat-containing protein [Candidatus Obscuribacter sp.]|nr:WG repeat-containing protein [Candidatus Obscuribacter sp.]
MRARFQAMILASFIATSTVTNANAYNTVGVIDCTGKTIVPCEYHRVEVLTNGFFFLEKMDKVNPLKVSYDGIIVDDDGKPISLNIPAGSTLSKVFLPDKVSNTKNTHSLPEGTILEIHGSEGFGLCRVDGTLILEPKFDAIGNPIQGHFPISGGNPNCRTMLMFMLNSNTGKRVNAPANAKIKDTARILPIPFEMQRDGQSTWGYMNLSGNVAIEPTFARANEFSQNGLAMVTPTRSRKNAYIDRTGKIVSPIFDHADDFHDNTAIVETTTGKVSKKGLINEKFEFVLAPDYTQLERLFENTFAAQKNDGDQWQAISSTGKFLFSLPVHTKRVSLLTDGILCETQSPSDEVKRYVVIDRTGQTLRSSNGDSPLHFKFGLAVLPTERKKQPREWKLIDKDGRVLQTSSSAFLSVVSANRILKYVQHEHFVPAAWQDPNPLGIGGFSRFDHFAYFLNDFNLIDMPRAQVEKMLGSSERQIPGANFYWIGYGPCGNSWTAIEIEFDQNRVSRWREVWQSNETQHAAPWVTTNVMVDMEQSSPNAEPRFKFNPKRESTLQ